MTTSDPTPRHTRARERATLRVATLDEVSDLFVELDEDLLARYGPDEPLVQIAPADVRPPSGRLLVAGLPSADPTGQALPGERLVGCAGVRRLEPGTAELKRMYVRPEARGRGIARLLLAGCEQAARELGYRRMWLETGVKQPEAVALYEAAGYIPVTPFGPAADNASSIFLGRDLRD
jgi:GNAT superfamily N-acetyltransferase